MMSPDSGTEFVEAYRKVSGVWTKIEPPFTDLLDSDKRYIKG